MGRNVEGIKQAMKDTVVGKSVITAVLIVMTICLGVIAFWSFGQTRDFFMIGAGTDGTATFSVTLAVVFSVITQIGPTALWVVKELEEESGHDTAAEIMWIAGWFLTIIDASTNIVAYWNSQSSFFPDATRGVFQIIVTLACVAVTQAEEVMVFFFAYALHHYNEARVLQGKKPKPWMDMLGRGLKQAGDIRRPNHGGGGMPVMPPPSHGGGGPNGPRPNMPPPPPNQKKP